MPIKLNNKCDIIYYILQKIRMRKSLNAVYFSGKYLMDTFQCLNLIYKCMSTHVLPIKMYF